MGQLEEVLRKRFESGFCTCRPGVVYTFGGWWYWWCPGCELYPSQACADGEKIQEVQTAGRATTWEDAYKDAFKHSLKVWDGYYEGRE